MPAGEDADLILDRQERFTLEPVPSIDVGGSPLLSPLLALRFDCRRAVRCLARVVETVEGRGGVCLVTADHGNAELMLNPDGSPNTAHTTNPVPLIVTRHGVHLRDGGRLADVAPTVLALLGVAQPATMTGASLVG
jgi:hypothetical protein